nr:hypothetical protein [Tanacetum cinerariifolium]
MLVQVPILQGEGLTVPETEVPQPSSPTHTYVADKAASTGVNVRHGGAAITVSSLGVGHGSGNIDKTPFMPHDSPIPRVNTLESDEDSMTLNELTVLCITLSQKVESLEADLKQTKKVYGAAYTKLIIKGRSMIEEIDQDVEVYLVTPTQVLAEVANVYTYTRRRRTISTASGGISTIEESVSAAGASMPVSTVCMVDNGKAIMQESEPGLTTTKLQQRQERVGYEAALRLQE